MNKYYYYEGTIKNTDMDIQVVVLDKENYRNTPDGLFTHLVIAPHGIGRIMTRATQPKDGYYTNRTAAVEGQDDDITQELLSVYFSHVRHIDSGEAVSFDEDGNHLDTKYEGCECSHCSPVEEPLLRMNEDGTFDFSRVNEAEAKAEANGEELTAADIFGQEVSDTADILMAMLESQDSTTH